MTSYQYRKSHCGDKTILRPSYLHNGIFYTGKTTSLYWIRPLAPCHQATISHYIDFTFIKKKKPSPWRPLDFSAHYDVNYTPALLLPAAIAKTTMAEIQQKCWPILDHYPAKIHTHNCLWPHQIEKSQGQKSTCVLLIVIKWFIMHTCAVKPSTNLWQRKMAQHLLHIHLFISVEKCKYFTN